MKALIQRLPDPDGDLDLVLFEDKTVGVRWAGCLYGPAPKLDEVLDPADPVCAAAKKILSLMHHNPHVFRKTEFVDVDNGLGLLEVSRD